MAKKTDFGDRFEILIFDYYSQKFRNEFRDTHGNEIYEGLLRHDIEQKMFKEHMIEMYGIDILGLDEEYHFVYAIVDSSKATWFKLEQG